MGETVPVAGGAEATIAVGILLLALGSAMDVEEMVWDEAVVEDSSVVNVGGVAWTVWDAALDCTPAGLRASTDEVVFAA